MSYLEGHRQRLRSRFNESGLAAFEDHEVIELLLTFAIPRKDVKPIARALLDRFGSLSNTLDATTDEIASVPGIGAKAGTLLHLMPALTRRYLRDRWGDKPRLATRPDIGRFVVDELATATHERFLLIALSHEHHVIRSLVIHEGSLDSAPVYPRLIVEAALRHKAARVILAHNHPGGIARPSEQDIDITRTLCAVLYAIGIPVIDHVIVAGPRIFSFADAGLLPAPGSFSQPQTDP